MGSIPEDLTGGSPAQPSPSIPFPLCCSWLPLSEGPSPTVEWQRTPTPQLLQTLCFLRSLG